MGIVRNIDSWLVVDRRTFLCTEHHDSTAIFSWDCRHIDRVVSPCWGIRGWSSRVLIGWLGCHCQQNMHWMAGGPASNRVISLNNWSLVRHWSDVLLPPVMPALAYLSEVFFYCQNVSNREYIT